MILDQAIIEVQQICGWRSDKVAEITRAIQYAQIEREKPNRTYPWFLRTQNDTAIITSQGTVQYPIPSDYIEDTEEIDGNLFIYLLSSPGAVATTSSFMLREASPTMTLFREDGTFMAEESGLVSPSGISSLGAPSLRSGGIAQFDPVTAHQATVAGSGLIVTSADTTSLDQGAHLIDTQALSSGKYYFEITYVNQNSNNLGSIFGAGVGTVGSTFTSMSSGVGGALYHFPGGSIVAGGSGVGSLGGGWSFGDILGVAVDLDLHQIWFRHISFPGPSLGPWNGAGVNGNPATNTGGFAIVSGAREPYACFGGTGGLSGDVLSANFGASSFSGTVPSGFSSWESAVSVASPPAGPSSSVPTPPNLPGNPMSRTVFLKKQSFESAQIRYYGEWPYVANSPPGAILDTGSMIGPGVPRDYYLGDTFVILYPPPDGVYYISWRYWAQDAPPTLGLENKWLKNAPWVLIGDAAAKISADLGYAQGVQTASAISASAAQNLFVATINRNEAGRRRSMGSRL